MPSQLSLNFLVRLISTPTFSPLHTNMSKSSQDEILAVMDCFRYGDLEEGDFEDIKRFTSAYGDQVLAELVDDRGNTALHMAGGNGHTGKSMALIEMRKSWISGLILKVILRDDVTSGSIESWTER